MVLIDILNKMLPLLSFGCFVFSFGFLLVLTYSGHLKNNVLYLLVPELPTT